MSEKREPCSQTTERIPVWSCLIKRSAIALCRAAIHVSTGCCLWASPQRASTAGLFVRPAQQNANTAGSLVQPQRPKKRVFVPACAAVRNRLPTSLRGAELRIPFLEHWL